MVSNLLGPLAHPRGGGAANVCSYEGSVWQAGGPTATPSIFSGPIQFLMVIMVYIQLEHSRSADLRGKRPTFSHSDRCRSHGFQAVQARESQGFDQIWGLRVRAQRFTRATYLDGMIAALTRIDLSISPSLASGYGRGGIGCGVSHSACRL